ncbi:AMP-binding protein [Nocardiopsis alba]|uniref:AMP-binding protein n=1 Tax=Nocardiopsis alba TaxID=53437 RepID=A0A7K2IYD6_9ACTN|nr:long-chain fatty acid--CoA ligase [Nocardiopsis alba]MYR34837.1 AMP-binding protein [Nocardiopsis alba]
MVVERVLRSLAVDPDRIAISDPREVYSAGQVRDQVYRTARVLLARGLGPGTTIALSGRVGPRMYILSRAIGLIGAAHLDVPVSMSPREQAELLAECGADLLVIDPEQTSAATTRILTAATGLDVCALSASEQVEDLFEQARDHAADPFPALARYGDPCQIGTTSGTTGRPKVVLRTFAPPPPPGPSWLGACFGPEQGPSRLLLTDRLSGLPLSLADAALGTGNRLDTLPEHGVSDLLSTVASERITHLYLPVYRLAELLAAPEAADTDLSSLRAVIVAGSALPPALLRRAVDRLGPIVHSLYGQTEAGNIARLAPEDYEPWNDAAARSVGRPLPGVDVRIRPVEEEDTNSKVDAGTGERGRVWVRTARLMDGYPNRPEATDEVLRDGWLDTGDIGYLDEAGRLVLLGRAGDAVAIGGRTVFPFEIDVVVQEHPDVQESVTFDVQGPGGDELHTVLVCRPGTRPEAADLLRRVEERMGADRTPASVVIVPRIPHTFSADPCRRTLRQWHESTRSTVVHAEARS